MKRVQANGEWTLFCPNEAPGLSESHSAEFEALYERYEAEGRGRKTIKAQELWFKIVEAQVETGTPYILYKDSCNSKSNQEAVLHVPRVCQRHNHVLRVGVEQPGNHQPADIHGAARRL